MKSQLDKMESDAGDPETPPTVPFWHMKPNADGQSTIERQELADFIRKSVSGDADPFWMREFQGNAKAVWFNVMPVGWVGEWHPSPALQWVIVLTGRWFIETQDGQRIEMGPGDIHWGEDVSDSGATTQINHRSGQIGAHPCVQIMVQFSSKCEQAL
ncbi:hypothetical protein SAMN05216517_101205 [Janthinobacterium sp. OK676]|jgi:hypothetical protein|uniref:hypothetical protein n=1 Tax=Janthinobacterium sp. OK676 TaxID=1855295 RepID=UPI0008884E0C|nr:hypothetical protein [Janthinobacterium sp. OK676]SDL45698.1 hypothetical protein SAMN05216517_101205 [Janthinobacterium sp. OK676]